MYSWVRAGVKLALGLAIACGPSLSSATSASSSCDPVLTKLFTPIRPQLGRYEVCTSTEPLTRLAQPGWTIEAVAPLDAFGAAASFDRARVARLYGGRRATVARGWRRRDGRFEAVTLISPHPNRGLTKLESSTLVIRHFVSE